MSLLLRYRLPQHALRTVVLSEVSAEEATVVLRPYEGTALYFGAEQALTEEAFWSSFGNETAKEKHCVPSPVYQERIANAVERIHGHQLNKVVLSRPHFLPNSEVSASQAFAALDQSYPQCTVFALHHPLWGSWMGATPEVLLEDHDGGYRSMSLAGTRLSGSQHWGDKEREEQKWVTKEIHRTLSQLGGKVKRGAQETLCAGPVEHLLTWVATDRVETPVLQVLEALHPTPAVCGTPPLQAQEMIRELEDYNRQLYTGYFAFLAPELHAVVLLRAMQWHKDGITFFAGGGITKDSVPLSEWMETEHKIRALRDVVLPA